MATDVQASETAADDSSAASTEISVDDLAGRLDLDELAKRVDLDDLAKHIELDEIVRADHHEVIAAIDQLAFTLKEVTSSVSSWDVVQMALPIATAAIAAFLTYWLTKKGMRWQADRDRAGAILRAAQSIQMLKYEIEKRWKQQILDHFQKFVIKQKALDEYAGLTAAEILLRTSFDTHDLAMVEQVVHFSDRYSHLDDSIVATCLTFHYSLHDIVDQLQIFREYCKEELIPARAEHSLNTPAMLSELRDTETIQILWEKVCDAVVTADQCADTLVQSILVWEQAPGSPYVWAVN